MTIDKIENRTQLKMKIMELHAKAFEQETQIAHHLKELTYMMQPAVLFRRLVSGITGNNEAKSDMIHTGKNLAVNLISGAWSRNRKGIVSGLALMVAKKAFSYFMQRRAEKKVKHRKIFK